MTDDRWWREFDAVVAAALPANSRVLDLGCGDGGLVDRLIERGFDAIGVDPRAPSHPRLIRERIEQATGLGSFDAITAVMALHHAELDVVIPTLTRLLRPRGHLFADFHTRSTIEQALSARFEATVVVRRPYLARMLARPDLEAEEHALIDAQLLPALGFWYLAGVR